MYYFIIHTYFHVHKIQEQAKHPGEWKMVIGRSWLGMDIRENSGVMKIVLYLELGGSYTSILKYIQPVNRLPK